MNIYSEKPLSCYLDKHKRLLKVCSFAILFCVLIVHVVIFYYQKMSRNKTRKPVSTRRRRQKR